jgi:long-subunit fatty acid transport protein
LLAVVAFPVRAAAHNGMKDTGVSLRQLGRGGAFVATDPDAGALSGNPAAIAFLEQPDFFLDLRLSQTSVEYEGLLNARSQRRDYWMPNVGYAAPFRNKFAWGLGVATIANQGYSLRDFDLSLAGAPPGTFDNASSQLRYIAVTPGVAVKLGGRTAAGFALSWSSGETSDQSYNIFSNTVGQELSGLAGQGYAWRLGVYHRPDPDTALGAYWRSRSHLDVSGGTLTMGPMSLAPGARFENVTVEGGDFPEEYGVGLQRRVGCKLNAIAEYRRIKWAAVRKTITINPPGGPSIPFAMNWNDQDVYVLGAEYYPSAERDTVWRGGINYAKSPIPDSTLSPIFAATNELHYSAGWEKQLNGKWRLITGLSFSPSNPRTSSADNLNNLRFGGGQPFTVGADVWEFGIGFSWSPGKKRQCASCACDQPCEWPDGDA